jgi:hypothetical protein
VIVRVLNPSAESERATLRFGIDVRHARPVRLDEGAAEFIVSHADRDVSFDVPSHALRSLRVNLD